MILTYQSNDAGLPSKRNTYEMVVLIFLDLFDSPDSVPLTQAYHFKNNKKGGVVHFALGSLKFSLIGTLK